MHTLTQLLLWAVFASSTSAQAYPGYPETSWSCIAKADSKSGCDAALTPVYCRCTNTDNFIGLSASCIKSKDPEDLQTVWNTYAYFCNLYSFPLKYTESQFLAGGGSSPVASSSSIAAGSSPTSPGAQGGGSRSSGDGGNGGNNSDGGNSPASWIGAVAGVVSALVALGGAAGAWYGCVVRKRKKAKEAEEARAREGGAAAPLTYPTQEVWGGNGGHPMNAWYRPF